ncbi:MAG: hypothetical protein ACXAE3_10055, partial [Candidatus Kariarchaeaceae archaeon]
QEVNFTLVFDGNNATANVTFGPYEPGSIFEWSSILYAGNDTLINQSRIIDRIDHKLVEIGDGSPTLSIEIDANDADSLIRGTTIYTRNASVTFIVLTTVPKGNITGLSLLKVDNDTSPLSFTPINGSLQDIELNTTVTYPSEGIYNATVLAETDKGLSYNLTYTIYVDQTLPTVASLSTVGGGSLVTTDGRVTFNFEFADGLSGVKVAILDTGDGQSVDVTNMDEYTHRYMDYESNTYRYQLTVIDFAGNVFVTDTISVSLSVDTSQATRAPSTGVIFFFIALIALFTSPIWGPRIVEALQDRF